MKPLSFLALVALAGSAFWLGCAAPTPGANPAPLAPVAKPRAAQPVVPPAPSLPRLAFKQNDPALDEVSGVGVVRSHPQLLWMHNDSGDTPRLFAVNQSGEIVLTVNLEGAHARDWEDMSVTRSWVYVGDIGDNLALRPNIQVYRFQEPKMDAARTGVEVRLQPGQWQMMTLRFPDGARNCESLAATPDGRLLLVSKEEAGTSGFYVWNAPFKDKTSATLSKIGAFRLGASGLFTKLATGTDFSPDGRKLVVTTYTDLYEFPLARPFDFGSLRFEPRKSALPPQQQCEAVCYSLDGKTIFSTGEGHNAPVWEVASGLGSGA